jgi:hypothetical protein
MPHLSRTILRKALRTTTEEADYEYLFNYLWLLRTRMPMLRRQDLLYFYWAASVVFGNKRGN